MAVRQQRGPKHRSLAVLLAVVGLTALMASPGTVGGSRAAPTPSPIIGPYASCHTASILSSYSGTLEVLGGAAAPNTTGVALELAYSYSFNYTPSGGTPDLTCVRAYAQALTNATGGFTLNATVPAGACGPGYCSSYSGPVGPAVVTIENAPPAGYFPAINLTGSAIAATWVAALSSVSISPSSTPVVSALAPIEVVANATAGNGAPTPAAASFDWQLAGAGWTISSGNGTDSITLRAPNATSSLAVSLWVNGTYNGSVVSAVSPALSIQSVATLAGPTVLAPTEPEIGLPVTLSVNGTGAAGYAYTARFSPGLGAPDLLVPCAIHDSGSASIGLSCATSVEYSSVGTAQPSVVLSNGYSSARAHFPSIAVVAQLALSLGPDPLVVYVGASAPAVLRVLPGTGRAPYGPACFWSGAAAPVCTLGGDGNWTFVTSYSNTGSYSARGTLVDAGGVNRSATAAVEVALRPSLSALSPPEAVLPAGELLELASTLSGGAGPIDYWWNDSLPSGTISAGTLSAPGPVDLAYSSSIPGIHTISLTIRDRLGTDVATAASVDVEDGPATSIGPVGPAPGPAIAGAPYPLSWTATDAFGHPLSGFSELLEFNRTAADLAGTVWLNTSGGAYALTAAAPSVALNASFGGNGAFNFSLAANAAGAWSLAIRSGVPVSDAPRGWLSWTVAPDDRDLELFDRSVAASTLRSSEARYRIADAYGNSIPSGYVVVRLSFGIDSRIVDSPVEASEGESWVWVNYSAPDASAGTVFVSSEDGQSLLPPTAVPAAPTADAALLLASFLAAVAIVAWIVVRQRPRRRPQPAAAPREAHEEDLRRVAEGRALLLAHADPSVPHTAAELGESLGPLGPTHEELSEWLGALVTDGSLRAELGPEGAPRFYRVVGGDDAPARWQIELDPEALTSALAQQEMEPGNRGGSGPDPNRLGQR